MWLSGMVYDYGPPALEEGPWVSCICPTYNRQGRHEQLYKGFAAQDYGYKELLILDDSPQPSPFFQKLRDPDVYYAHSPVRVSIGQKRNILIAKSRGEIIAHFDDDDLYAPRYVTEMVRRLEDADLVKLSVFNIINERDGSRWRWDTRTSGGSQNLMSAKGPNLCLAVPFGSVNGDVTRWGYGFSYVYRRALWEAVQFPDINLREDYEFIKRARAMGAQLKQVADCADLVWHSVHNKSMSTAFPQTRLDGPASIPFVNIIAGSALGVAAGTVLGGPLGALVGGGVGTALTGAFASATMGAESEGEGRATHARPFMRRVSAGGAGGLVAYLTIGGPIAVVGGILAGALVEEAYARSHAGSVHALPEATAP